MSYKVFVINPGSTSTKLAYFDGEKKPFETNVFHDAPELAEFATINDQLPYRKKVIEDFLAENGIDLTGVDAIVGRGGACAPCKGGVYEVNDLLLADTRNSVGGVQHPANLGIQLAVEMQGVYGGRVFMVDPPKTDEFEDIARVTGIDGIYRTSNTHALNLKGTVRLHCKKNGLSDEYQVVSASVESLDASVVTTFSEGECTWKLEVEPKGGWHVSSETIVNCIIGGLCGNGKKSWRGHPTEHQEDANRAAMKQRLDELEAFLDEHQEPVTDYDEGLVRRLIERITVYDGRLVFEFKSGLETEVQI